MHFQSERQNDGMILKANEHMMNQTMASILKAEERNDNVIKKIIQPAAKKSAKAVDPVFELG
ncbi:MAG: hypothetical protein ACREA3_08370 [Nitrosotalea sp.]